MNKRIAVLAFWAMVSVVAIHSHSIGTMENPARWLTVTETFLFRGMTSWAVPFFFMVSGYFFARGVYFKQGGGYRELLRKKYHTLLVPYFWWAIIGTAIGLPLLMTNNAIMGRQLLERTFLAKGFGWSAVNSLFGITEYGPHGNLALWYVRTLIVLFLLAPVWKWLRLRAKWVLAAIWFAGTLVVPEIQIPGVAVKMLSFGWFALGVFLESEWLEKTAGMRALMIGAGVVYFAESVVLALAKAGMLTMDRSWIEFIKASIPVLGISFWWGAVNRLKIKEEGKLPEIMRMNFWVYSWHGSVTGWFLASSLFVLGKNSLGAIAASACSIAGALIICLTTGVLVKRQWPKIYGVLSGGRNG